jgi:hypothetical protein
MASVVIAGDTSGTVTLAAPATAGTTTLTLPTVNGTVLTTGSSTGVNASAISTGTLAAARLPAGSVLQVVQTAKLDTFTTSLNQAWADVTGMSVTITPTNASNKILVFVDIGTINVTNNGALKLLRGSTDIFLGNAGTGQTRASAADFNGTGSNGLPASFCYLDSPATTSATTYKIQVFGWSSSTIYINLGPQDSGNAFRFRTASTITAMEIAG